MLLSGCPLGAEITNPATGRRQLSAPEAVAADGVAPAGEWLAVGLAPAPHALASVATSARMTIVRFMSAGSRRPPAGSSVGLLNLYQAGPYP